MQSTSIEPLHSVQLEALCRMTPAEKWNLSLSHIPPGIFHGFKAISSNEVLLINLPSEPYDRKNPDEVRRPWNDPAIGSNWDTEFR